MAFDASTWYLSVLPILLAYLISLVANMKLNGTREAIGGAIRSHHDLEQVRGAINQNKACAWLYLALWAVFLVGLVVCARFTELTFREAVGHIFAFGLLTLPGGLWSKAVENKFKAMTVDASDPSLREKRDRYFVNWKKSGFTVPE
jgi:hypothetical protein